MKTAARTVLRKLVEYRICNALVLTLVCAGCDHSNASRTSSAESAAFVSVPCAERSLPMPEDVEYVQLRQLLSGFNTVLLTKGTPCNGPEREECLAAVTNFENYSTKETEFPCHDVSCPMQTYAIVGRRGRPELLTTPSDLRKLLGTIDTPDEAWLIAMFSAKAVWPVCDQPEASAYRRRSSTFELRERRYTNRCPLTLSETIYHVGRDGSVTSSKPSVVSVVEGGCVE
jgi:hypothetical protein